MSQQDFIAAVYLERGEMLDSEVRRIIDEIDKSNQYVEAVNTLIGKANVAEYGTTHYSSPTWQVNGNSIVLDNGYGVNFKPDGNGGNTFTLLDSDGNQLIYQNRTLIPVPAGTTVDALEVGIPVMNDMTYILDDGTEITFKAGAPDTAFNSADFSGGLADITRIVITRDNQGMQISNVNDEGAISIGAPTVESPTDPVSSVATTTTQTVNVARLDLFTAGEYDGSDDYNTIDGTHAGRILSMWEGPIKKKSPAEQAAILAQIEADGGMDIYWHLGESDNSDDYYNKTFTYQPYANETLYQFIERAVDRSKVDFRNYVNDEEGAIDIEYIDTYIKLPGYSYQEVVPATSKTTSSISSKSISESRNFYDSDDYGSIKTFTNDYTLRVKSDVAKMNLTPEQRKGLERELQANGYTLNLTLEDTDGVNETYTRSYNYRMVNGESLDGFFERVMSQSAERFKAYIDFAENEGDINIESISASSTLPGFSYDKYAAVAEAEEDPSRPNNRHSLDINNHDGHILFEAGGMHQWEYDGRGTQAISATDPNDSSSQVSGYFARKLAFRQSSSNEFDSTTPFLTQKEKELLGNILRITYPDASGNGLLNPEEWGALKKSLINARDNLNGNSQLQTVQLQRAMQTYNQNYEAMSNAQQKIYSLLRDIISNVK
ncbi:hypothetical protein [Endozoicomonas sp. SCSIO W0465]|uniref:hypothetical protein n=1 Tax=Endozoicomonas sp. SCSIO W0465 TaxID=2918516 RepID=UPI002074E69E|nr:hypothetical protein [Endozoicomonas sp. SCSIO W0465]USE35385.1 hypothetical protein MJO57_25310 [Endozoicomonas sp. SCSIO W0465]